MTSALPAPDAGAYAAPAARIEEVAGPRQTRLGTASLYIGVVVGLLQIGALVTTMAAFRIDPGHPRVSDDSTFLIAAFAILFGGVLVQALGLLLGIAGAFRRRHVRTHAWIGIVCNGLPVLVTAGLLALGSFFGPK
jgi:hypothetical protein